MEDKKQVQTESVTSESNWEAFLRNTKDFPPRSLVKRFIQYTKENKMDSSPIHVVDIGCGSGGDTNFYGMQEGFTVTAIDNKNQAIENVRTRMSGYAKITAKLSDITQEPIPECQVASASYSLPFISKDQFFTTWNNNITPNISPGGYFVGHFFGDKHGWAKDYGEQLTFLKREEAEKLFDPETSCFETPILFNEKEKEVRLANGGTQYWHRFAVIAQKKKTAREEEVVVDAYLKKSI